VKDFPALKWMAPPRHGAPPVSHAVTALVCLTVYEAIHWMTPLCS
jgi:hypothetical protein